MLNIAHVQTIYPSKAFEDDYKTDTPLIFAGIVAGTFVMVFFVYFIYDMMVHNRNEMMIVNAAQASAIVTEMVPSHLRDRLLKDKAGEQVAKKRTKSGSNLKAFLNEASTSAGAPEKPLADLFLETTVVFADISGFTAWSSVRGKRFTSTENRFYGSYSEDLPRCCYLLYYCRTNTGFYFVGVNFSSVRPNCSSPTRLQRYRPITHLT